ncbi:hypothetical protein HY407_04265 [Candidatus Gottesmanbacteria bacterium]|nr:hypothetical protein [Candidatus Gottesmanbacteria bacterium]
MMIKHLIIALFIGIIISNRFISPVYAIDPPIFPSCANPPGDVRVSNSSGNHGILGLGSLSGSDTVYNLEDGNILQCFCAENGSGIQTNFWKISSLSQEEIDQLKSLGWTFIPSGSIWGLSNEPYMAINSNYSCRGTTTTTTTTTTNPGSTGSVLGTSAAAGDVLGLAATGDSILLYGFAILGFSSLSLGLYLKKQENQ